MLWTIWWESIAIKLSGSTKVAPEIEGVSLRQSALLKNVFRKALIRRIITLRLSDFRSQTSLTLLLRNYELTSENVYFLTNQSKTKTFIDLKITRKPKPTKNSTRPYLNEIPVHFNHEIKTIAYDVT